MKYQDLVRHFGGMPLVESSALRMFFPDLRAMSVQLDRWVRSGRLLRLARGAYLLPAHLRRSGASPERIANLLCFPSYVSCERALEIYGLIPESVPSVTSVTPRSPKTLDTPAGRFAYRHVKPAWFFGYERIGISGDEAMVARPEKALLDLVHLSRGEFPAERIEALRLQNTALLDTGALRSFAQRGTPRVRRAGERLAAWLEGLREKGESP